MRARLGLMAVSSSWSDCGTVTVGDDPKRRVEAREFGWRRSNVRRGMTTAQGFVCRREMDRCNAQ
jgi:hypothetical protein